MTDLYLYDDIEPGMAAKFVAELKKVDSGEITLHVNSYGGDVFEGLTMMHSLRSHPATVTAIVEGVAASAASFIAVGGADRVVMREGTRMMVHNALSIAMGNADEMDKISSRLRSTSADIAAIYAERSGRDAAEWQSAMDLETWFNADEAVAAGLADAVESGRVEREPVLAVAGSRMMNQFRGRRGSPPAALLTHPEGGERRDDMSLTNLAQELGWDAGELVAALTRLKNESVPISGEVEVSYPDDVEIVPTERIKVEPVIGDKPAEPAEGEDVAPVDEGVDNADDSEPAAVRSLSDEDEEEPESPAGEVAPPAPVSSEPLVNKKVLDIDTYEELKAAAKFGWSAMEAKQESDLVDEVDTWIKEGRISAALRSKAVAAVKRDPATARDLYGSNPKNTIPRGEVGYGRDASAGETPNVPSAEELLELAKSRRSGSK